jgi:hypothetical protein
MLVLCFKNYFISDRHCYLLFSRNFFDASKQHVPCLAHVINIAVQVMLSKGGLEAEGPKEAESMDTEEGDFTDGLLRTSIVYDETEEADDTDPTSETTTEVEGNTSTKHALQKLRGGIIKIRYIYNIYDFKFDLLSFNRILFI